MNAIFWITTVTLVINAAQSYILLTANLEDVQSLAKQMADSPIADQLKKIWRRASNQFNQQMSRSKMHKRAENDKDDSIEEKATKDEEDQDRDSGVEDNAEHEVERRRADGQADDVAALGRNASYYLSSIKNMMDKI